jgi:hypothetical protein
MSLLLIATVSAIVMVSTGYLAGVRVRRERRPRPARRKPAGPVRSDAMDLDDLPLALGDVVSYDGEERWLSGAVIASERGRVIAALWVAPEGAAQHAVATFRAPDLSIYWLQPAAVSSPEEPPATIDLNGVAMRRLRRLPVALTRIGQGAPDVGETGMFATYEGPGRDVTVLIVTRGRAQAWSGRKLDPDEYERLGDGGLAEQPDEEDVA